MQLSSHNPSPEEALWDKWLTHKDEQTANELIEHYMYLVNFHVDRLGSHLPNTVEREELKSLGLIGLFDAIQKFEVKRNLKFDTYASYRVKGSIIDGLRKEDWLSRSMREKSKKITAASQALEQKLQRIPTVQEISREVEMTIDEVEDAVKDTLFSNVLSIDEKPKQEDASQYEGVGYSISDNDAVQPSEQALAKELNEELAQSLRLLNENEQLVVSLFYYDELTLTEIGQIMDLTTSRISQIHKTAIFKLRNILKKIV